MPQTRFNISKLLIPLFLLSVFLLSLTKTYDVDAWLHLTMGKVIWELKGIPDKEPFLYTMADKPFEYSSWLFGVIYYLAYKIFNVYGMILLKASTITLAFYIILKDSLTEGRKRGRTEGLITRYALRFTHSSCCIERCCHTYEAKVC